MREIGRFLYGAVGMLMAIAGVAHAERTMVVVIDASGSMQTATRFATAKSEANTQIDTERNDVLGLGGGVAVYTLNGDSQNPLHLQTAGFVTPDTAIGVINSLTVTGDSTPLAAGLCNAIDIASNSGSHTTGSARLLEVFSDGDENNSIGHVCFGTHSQAGPPDYDSDSWQFQVRTRALNLPAANAIQFSAALFTDVGFARRTANLEPKASLTALAGVTDAAFFADLAAATGGVFRTVVDNTPQPVYADVDGDFDVDRADAILLARQFGRPATPTFDLNNDGKIGFADYSILIARFGTGTGTPVPDPFVSQAPVVCSTLQKVVIDGKKIESSGITIDARLGCTVVIKNSLIVSGQNAIQIRGGAAITVDNSTLVGENAVLVLEGGASLSAANTIFHGNKKLVGLLTYIDRGNNIWE